ncbi:hypothetical protein BS47DRAFT_768129 [Hydnum rufescens UP504]|uniref:Uncharacterized protein n=1 Tax=Hydnum rufescens UP504 TaxID=1448309 RepID=A0A9P6B0S4_9AGAM|nr:hypothetical protein BS47DRAFT_768129 [Hydnum rufescens UP504]
MSCASQLSDSCRGRTNDSPPASVSYRLYVLRFFPQRHRRRFHLWEDNLPHGIVKSILPCAPLAILKYLEYLGARLLGRAVWGNGRCNQPVRYSCLPFEYSQAQFLPKSNAGILHHRVVFHPCTYRFSPRETSLDCFAIISFIVNTATASAPAHKSTSIVVVVVEVGLASNRTIYIPNDSHLSTSFSILSISSLSLESSEGNLVANSWQPELSHLPA